jgi:hypothetical protein
VQAAHPEVTIAQTGSASVWVGANDKQGQDLARTETISLPITFVVLLVTFRCGACGRDRFIGARMPLMIRPRRDPRAAPGAASGQRASRRGVHGDRFEEACSPLADAGSTTHRRVGIIDGTAISAGAPE